MRVTNKSLINNFTRNLSRNLNNMSKYQNQLSTGKEVSHPSDDPLRVVRAMALHTSVGQNEQFSRNIEDSMGWTDMTDSSLGNINDDLQRVRELVVKGSNGSMSDTDQYAIRVEMEQLVGDIAQVGNANYDGRYIFGGQSTTSPPFEIDGNGVLKYNGDQGSLEREISSNVTMKINVHGGDIMGDTDGLATTLQKIVGALDSGDKESLSDDLLAEVDQHIDNILRLRATVGAKSNRLEAAKERNEAETLSLTALLSKAEDIDYAEKVMQYSNMSNVYEASLSTGAKIIQPTLLDFLG